MSGDLEDPEGEQRPEEGAKASWSSEAQQAAPVPKQSRIVLRPGTRTRQADWLTEALAPTIRAFAEMQRQVAANSRLMKSIYESTRFVDRVIPDLVRPFELAAAAQLARVVSGPSSLLTARLAVAAQFHVNETLKRIQIPPIQMTALEEASRAIASISEAFIARTRLFPEVDKAVAQVVAGWRFAVSVRPLLPPVELDRLMAASATTLEVATAGSVIVGAPPPEVEGRPWEEAPRELRERMRERLSEIDPALVRKLDGVWERVSTPGPDAASQASNSLIELIDWFLRLAAPEADVLAWHATNQRAASELTDDGRPTRGLRVSYVLVAEQRDPKAVRRFTGGLADILGFLQGAKHGIEFDDVAAIRRVIPAVEALLTYILL